MPGSGPGPLTKADYEAFRVEKFGQPLESAMEEPDSSQEGDEGDRPGADDEGDLTADCSRVILHFDADCFYAQVEELRDPSLRTKPLGISQKYLVVTCNYPARQGGVTKLMNIEEAKKKCPQLVLVPGEDLTPYRKTSASIFSVLSKFGSAAQKLGMDEVFVDVTSQCKEMLHQYRSREAGHAGAGEDRDALLRWCGRVHRSKHAVHSETRYRPMDLRVDNQQPAVQACGPGEHGQEGAHDANAASDPDLLLMAGSILGARARAAVREQVGVRMCCGIAHNKLLAKLASGLHKPDAQTSLPASEALDFLRPLPVQVLRGAGYKTCRDLQAAGIETVAQLRGVSKQRLMAMIGDRVGAHLFEAARGRDRSAVETTSAPKSITVEDSFKRCTSWQALALILEVLAPDLLARVDEDASLHRRLPATLTVTWRHVTSKYGRRQSASIRFPAGQSLAPCDVRALQKRASQIAVAAETVLRKHLKEPFHLTLLNLGVSGFFGVGPACKLLTQTFAAVERDRAIASSASVGGEWRGRCRMDSGNQCWHAREAQDGSFDQITRERADYDFKLRRMQGEGRHGGDAETARWADGAPLRGVSVLSKMQERVLRENGSSLPSRRCDHDGISASVTQMSMEDASMTQTSPGAEEVRCHALLSGGGVGEGSGQASTGVKSDGGERSDSAMQVDSDRSAQAQVACGEEASVWAGDAQVEYPGGAIHRSFAIEYVDEWSDGNGSFDCDSLSDASDVADSSDKVGLEQPQYRGREAEIGRKRTWSARTWSADLPEGQSQGVSDDEGNSDGFSGGSEFKRKCVDSVRENYLQGWEESLEEAAAGCEKDAQGLHQRHDEGEGGSRVRAEGAEHREGYFAQVRALGREDTCPLKGQTCQRVFALCGEEQEKYETEIEWECDSAGDEEHWFAGDNARDALRATSASTGEERGEAATGCSGAGLAGEEMGVILHVDVDSFYCNVERIDDPSLEGVPIAVQQFNSGGFVAVSYEAQAKGIRKGDGVGAGGRAAARNGSERLKGLIGRVSLAEAKTKCPELRVLPMRTDRYREVAAQLHQLLAEYASQVEKASYDDFYLDCTATLGQRPPIHDAVDLARVRVIKDACDEAGQDPCGVGAGVGGRGTRMWGEALEGAPELLRAATNLAIEIQASVRERMGMSVSIGVACNKLQARLISGLNKPQGITVLLPARVTAFMAPLPLMSIPTLRGKGGEHVCRALAINTVGKLRQFTQRQLVSRFGERLGCWLASLPTGGLWEDPKDRGRAKSLLAERSCPPTSCPQQCRELLCSLAGQLYQRLVDECRAHARLPNKLILSWRQNYDNVRCKSARVPQQLSTALAQIRAHALQEARVTAGAKSSSAPGAAAVTYGDISEHKGELGGDRSDVKMVKVLEEAAMDLLQSGVSKPWKITRLAVSCSMADDSSSSGQASLSSFLIRNSAADSPSCSSGHQVLSRTGVQSRTAGAKGGGGGGGGNPVHTGVKVVDSGASIPVGKDARDAAASPGRERLGGIKVVLSSPETGAHPGSGGRRVEHAAACMRAAFGWLDADAPPDAPAPRASSSHGPQMLTPAARAAESSSSAQPQSGTSGKGGGPVSVYTPGLVALANMGFSDEQAALAALRQAKGSVSAAIEFLVGASPFEAAPAPHSGGRGNVSYGHGRIETAGGAATKAAVAVGTGGGLGRKGSKAAGKARNTGAGGGARGKGAGKISQRGQTLIASFLAKSTEK